MLFNTAILAHGTYYAQNKLRGLSAGQVVLFQKRAVDSNRASYPNLHVTYPMGSRAWIAYQLHCMKEVHTA